MSLFVESLERRRLLDATLAGGVLTLTGTNRHDQIEVDLRDSGELKIEINNREQEFDYSAITKFVIHGLAGNDKIEFNQRNVINKGTEIRAGAGRDTVEGADARDTIFGGAGNDVLDGRNGSDVIYGEAGHDILEGKSGNDKVFGGSGHDWLEGDEGNDTLNGGAGLDDLEGNAGFDNISGGSGNDDFNNSDSSAERVDQTGLDDGTNGLPFVV